MDIKKGDSVYIYSDTQNDFEGIVVFVSSKYITVQEGTYGRKWRFDKETRICKDWSVYMLFESKEDVDKFLERREKERFVKYEIDFATRKMTDEEFETIYNIVKKYQK